jgi:hypothetical protein
MLDFQRFKRNPKKAIVGFRLMYNLAVDLALNILITNLLIREELLYSQQQENSSQKSI